MTDFIRLHEEGDLTTPIRIPIRIHIINISSINDMCPGREHTSMLPVDKNKVIAAITENAFTDEGTQLFLHGGTSLYVYESIQYIQTQLCKLGNKIV